MFPWSLALGILEFYFLPPEVNSIWAAPERTTVKSSKHQDPSSRKAPSCKTRLRACPRNPISVVAAEVTRLKLSGNRGFVLVIRASSPRLLRFFRHALSIWRNRLELEP